MNELQRVSSTLSSAELMSSTEFHLGVFPLVRGGTGEFRPPFRGARRNSLPLPIRGRVPAPVPASVSSAQGAAQMIELVSLGVAIVYLMTAVLGWVWQDFCDQWVARRRQRRRATMRVPVPAPVRRVKRGGAR